MVFSSLSFLWSFAALFLAYYCVPRRFRQARNLILLLFSLAFYAWGSPRFLLLMFASILIDYLCGLLAAQGNPPGLRRAGAVLAVALGLGLLGWFKYAGFLARTVNHLGAHIPVPEVVLPIGISFFTFQGLSYVLDVYRDDIPVQRSPLMIALYISFFPQLVAGPIVRYAAVADGLRNRRESLAQFSGGATRFLFGLGKKMLLANAMGQVADGVFAQDPGALYPSLAWLGAAAYALQIYIDFSAYSDMAIGLGEMFGFHFPENFNYPYVSQSITEFWRRWHISLSSWFRDYVYIPLGGNRCSALRHVCNLAVVWLLTGLWHGAAWTFVAWGLWYLLLLLGEKYLWGGLLRRAPAPLRHCYALLLVVLGWVLFRSGSLSGALSYWGAMLGRTAGTVQRGQAVYYLLEFWPEWIAAVLVCLPIKPALQAGLEGRDGWRGVLLTWGPKLLALALLALSYAELVTGSFNPFIYFRF